MYIEQLSQRVLTSEEVVNYSQMIRQAFSTNTIQSTQFVGFKILLQDLDPGTVGRCGSRIGTMMDARFNYVLSNVKDYLARGGLFLRETDPMRMSNGLWLVSLPVPRRSQKEVLDRMMSAVQALDALGVKRAGMVEINMSGKLTPADAESAGVNFFLPESYLAMMTFQPDAQYRFGKINRINDTYACVRTRWKMGDANTRDLNQVYNDIITLLAILPGIFASYC